MKKLKNENGFTLAELLIVVAIVSVLVAISIPIFNGKLEKAKLATNNANIRSAKAAAVAEYLASNESKEVFYEYNIQDGNIKQIPESITTKFHTDPNMDGIHENIVVCIDFSAENEIFIKTMPYFNNVEFVNRIGSMQPAKNTEKSEDGSVHSQSSSEIED